jgi:NADH pyrophosphatase NudC (nudix superfamily)
MTTEGWRFCPCCGGALGTEALAGRNRGVCRAEGCGFVAWDNPLPVVAALIECEDRDGRILLARNRNWPDRQFGLVTGFLECGESPEAAVTREVAEETGLAAREVAPIGVYPFFPANEILLAYHVRAQGEIVLNDELAEFRLIEVARLKAWDFGTGLAVRDWLATRRDAGAAPPTQA